MDTKQTDEMMFLSALALSLAADEPFSMDADDGADPDEPIPYSLRDLGVGDVVCS